MEGELTTRTISTNNIKRVRDALILSIFISIDKFELVIGVQRLVIVYNFIIYDTD